MRVLYVNHTAAVSGAERSLLELLGGLPPEVEPVLACPHGDLSAAGRALGIVVIEVPGTDGSLKPHPVRTPRAVVELLALAGRIEGEASGRSADVVHANSVRAGIATSLAARRLPPTVVHVRDCLPPGRISTVVRRLVNRRARLIVSNSAYTEARFGVGNGARARMEVVHNPVDLRRFDRDVIDRERSRAALGVPVSAPVLAVVAQLTPWKGQDTAVRALHEVRRRFPETRLLLVGAAKFVSRATRHDNLTYVRELRALVGELGLEANVAFLGERADIPAVLRATDILLVPSWEEPFGRTVVEGMAMGLPVLATARGGPAEVLTGGLDGLLLPPRDVAAWAAAILGLLEDPDRRAALGRAAHVRARSFSIEAHVARLVELYAQLGGRDTVARP